MTHLINYDLPQLPSLNSMLSELCAIGPLCVARRRRAPMQVLVVSSLLSVHFARLPMPFFLRRTLRRALILLPLWDRPLSFEAGFANKFLSA